MDFYARDILNRLVYHDCDEVQKLAAEEIEAIEDLNLRVNIKNVSPEQMASTIVRIRKEVTGSYKLKR